MLLIVNLFIHKIISGMSHSQCSFLTCLLSLMIRVDMVAPMLLILSGVYTKFLSECKDKSLIFTFTTHMTILFRFFLQWKMLSRTLPENT